MSLHRLQDCGTLAGDQILEALLMQGFQLALLWLVKVLLIFSKQGCALVMLNACYLQHPSSLA